jgi:sodium/proline symporter
MTRFAVAALSLLCFTAIALTLGAWAARRTHNATDFAAASRRLGLWLTAFGYSANTASAWLLMLLCAAAFVWGAGAVWLWVGVLLGAAINLFYLAPRIRAAAVGQNAVSVLQLLGADAGDRLQPMVVRTAAFIVVTMLLLQTAAALRLTLAMLGADFGVETASSVALCLAMVGACVFAGGVRGAAALEGLQALLTFVVAVLLLVPIYVGLGGGEQLQAALMALDPVWADPFGGKRSVVALAFAMGGVGLGIAATGQPQALNRFMAVRDEDALRTVRWVALAWIAALSAVVLIGGLAANVLYGGLDRPELAYIEVANRLLPPTVAAIFATALPVAVATSIAGPLLTIATTFAVDLKRASAPLSTPWLKAAVLLAAVLALVVSASAPAALLDHALFAFTALGAVIGPLMLVRMSGKRIRPGSMLGAMWSGFLLSLLFHLLPDAPGDFLERVLPFVAALGIALTGGERRRNPDRADRGQETVHDRIPI